MPIKPVQITHADVSATLTPDAVALASTDLVNNLIQEPAETLEFLAEDLAPISVDDIIIDALGRVVVRNAAFAQKVRDAIGQEGVSFNWKCTVS